MVYKMLNISRGSRTFKIVHDRDHYTVWNGSIFIASVDNIREAYEEIEEYHNRISEKDFANNRKRFC